MCGRYTLISNATDLWEGIAAAFPPSSLENVTPEQVDTVLHARGRRRYNIVPTSYEPIFCIQNGKIVLKTAHWWLLPSWGAAQVGWRRSKTGEKSFSWKGQNKSHFNSRWDTITSPDNRYWRSLLESKRCLIPADGFMEWPDDALRPRNQNKIPHYFRLRDAKPFFFAGLYDETVADEGSPFLSYNIITVEPNQMLRALPHHRMPAILAEESIAQWLEPSVNGTEAAKLLRPMADERMTSYPISNLVNSPVNESPRVIERRNENDLFLLSGPS